MKSVRLLFVITLVAVFGISITAQGQDHSQKGALKTQSFKVQGNCEMCKDRIEKAAKTDGVTKANWDSKTLLLALTYDPAKVKTDDVLKKIAAAGHDNEKFKAEQSAYNKLPECCKYR